MPLYMLLEDAAEALAVDPVWLDTICRKNKVVYCRSATDPNAAASVNAVDFWEVAKILKLDKAVAEKVAIGREWLMSGEDVYDTYGHIEVTRDKISGGAVFFTPRGKVYRVSPFIKWLLLNANEQEDILKGKKRNGKIQNKRAGQ